MICARINIIACHFREKSPQAHFSNEPGLGLVVSTNATDIVSHWAHVGYADLNQTRDLYCTLLLIHFSHIWFIWELWPCSKHICYTRWAIVLMGRWMFKVMWCLNPIQQSVSLVANKFPNIKAVTNYYYCTCNRHATCFGAQTGKKQVQIHLVLCLDPIPYLNHHNFLSSLCLCQMAKLKNTIKKASS